MPGDLIFFELAEYFLLFMFGYCLFKIVINFNKPYSVNTLWPNCIGVALSPLIIPGLYRLITIFNTDIFDLSSQDKAVLVFGFINFICCFTLVTISSPYTNSVKPERKVYLLVKAETTLVSTPK